jgi:hypothetical protein
MVENHHVPINVYKTFDKLKKITVGKWYKGIETGYRIRLDNISFHFNNSFSSQEQDWIGYGLQFIKLFDIKDAYTAEGERATFIRLNKFFEFPMDLFRYLIDYKEPKIKRIFGTDDLMIVSSFTFLVGVMLGMLLIGFFSLIW